MENIKLLIVDDEPLAHKVLEGYCEKMDYVHIAGHCYDGLSTLNFLNIHHVDAVLLDIQMPDLTGLELLDSLKNNAPKIIFTTAYTEYAIQGFNYDQVVDYLHKPIRLTRFIKALERLKKVMSLEKQFLANSHSHKTPYPRESTSDFISIKDSKLIYRLHFKDILYIQSWGNYLKVFLLNQDVKIIRKTIKSLEIELPSNLFLRIHKSYLINLKHIDAMEGNQIRLNDQKLPIGKSYQVDVKKRVLG